MASTSGKPYEGHGETYAGNRTNEGRGRILSTQTPTEIGPFNFDGLFGETARVWPPIFFAFTPDDGGKTSRSGTPSLRLSDATKPKLDHVYRTRRRSYRYLFGFERAFLPTVFIRYSAKSTVMYGYWVAGDYGVRYVSKTDIPQDINFTTRTQTS